MDEIKSNHQYQQRLMWSQYNYKETSMDVGDDDVFQSADKTAVFETVNLQPTTYVPQKTGRRINKNGESVSWKYANITNFSTISREQGRHTVHRRNVSFEQQSCYAKKQCKQQQMGEPQQQEQSALQNHYSATQQVYRKNFSFGTSWIAKRHYFASVFVKPQNIQTHSLQYYTPGNTPQQDEVNLQTKSSFDSEFQSGNLFAVYKISKFEYDLILQNDINTKGNTQWFYFRLNNPPKNRNIKINIVNMRKPDSLFNYGMKPCIFSLGEWKSSKKGWFRGGNHIRYFRNSHLIQGSCNYYYTLTFTISTVFDHDVLRVAQNYPYTTQDLSNYLQKITKIKYKKQLIHQQTITNTIGKHKIQCLTIKQSSKAKERPIILILARQHPGQTLSSYICEGIIDYFLSKNKESEYLRKHYQIKVVPMVNPDGVAAGNYRTNLFGCDVNRKWQGSKSQAPQQACLIKKYILENIKQRNIGFILDLHGHSRKLFSFFYGNPSTTQSSIHSRIFPHICSKIAPNFFRFQDCVFSNESYKRSTARVQLNASFKSLNILTFQASFFGYIDKNGEKKHFTTEGYRQLGSILGKAIYAYEKGKQMVELKLEQEPNLYLKSKNQLLNSKNLEALGQKDDSGSESNPEACELKQSEQLKLQENQQYGLLLQKRGKRPVRVLKKMLSRERQSESSNRAYKPMKFLQVSQVNSIFPQNNMALIPDSLLAKKQKEKYQNKINFGVQTEQVFEHQQVGQRQLMQQAFIDPYRSQIFTKSEVKIRMDEKKKQAENRLKSNVFFPPKNELLNNILFNTNGFRSFSQRKEYQYKKKINESVQRITRFGESPNATHKIYKKQMGCQTIICLLNGKKMEDQIRKTSSSDVKPPDQIDRSYLMYYNTIRANKPRGRSSRFATLNHILNKTSLNG